MRLPFLYVVHDDEAFYSVVATRWLNGELPYAASYDIKGPGLFALFAAVQAVLGSSLVVIKGIEIVFTAAGAIGLWQILSRRGLVQAAWWAGGLYPVYSLILLGVSSPAQIVQAALTIWMFAFALDARRFRHFAAAGLLAGLAVTVKQTAAFELVGLAGWLAWRGWKERDVRGPALMLVAAAIPPVVFGFYFFAAGAFREAFDAIIMHALVRSQVNMSSAPEAWYLALWARIAQFPALLKPVLVISAGALLAVLRKTRLASATSSALINVAVIWLLAAGLGALAVKSPEAWYIVPIIPPALILFVCLICYGIAFPARWRATWLTAYAAIAVLHPLWNDRAALFGKDFRGPPDYEASLLTARSLKAYGLVPNGNLLVLSRGHYVYLLTGALPKTRYFNAMHLLCAFPTPDADPLGAALNSQPDFIIMSDPAVAIGCARPERLQRVLTALESDYVPIETVKGRWDSFTIYKSRSPALHRMSESGQSILAGEKP